MMHCYCQRRHTVRWRSASYDTPEPPYQVSLTQQVFDAKHGRHRLHGFSVISVINSRQRTNVCRRVNRADHIHRSVELKCFPEKLLPTVDPIPNNNSGNCRHWQYSSIRGRARARTSRNHAVATMMSATVTDFHLILWSVFLQPSSLYL